MRRIRANTLVATMAAAVIVLVLAVVFLRGGVGLGAPAPKPRPDGKGTTVVGRVRYEAQDQVCRSNLGQIRQSLQIAQMNNGDQPVASLAETGLSRDFLRCPMGKYDYLYDPASGTVRCRYPGHESF